MDQKGGNLSLILNLVNNIYEMTKAWHELKDIAILFDELITNSFSLGGPYYIYTLLSILNRVEDEYDIYSMKLPYDIAWENLKIIFEIKRKEIDFENLFSIFVLKRQKLMKENEEMLNLGLTQIHTKDNLNDLFYLYNTMALKVNKNYINLNINNKLIEIPFLNKNNTKILKQYDINNYDFEKKIFNVSKEINIFDDTIIHTLEDEIYYDTNFLYVNKIKYDINYLSKSNISDLNLRISDKSEKVKDLLYPDNIEKSDVKKSDIELDKTFAGKEVNMSDLKFVINIRNNKIPVFNFNKDITFNNINTNISNINNEIAKELEIFDKNIKLKKINNIKTFNEAPLIKTKNYVKSNKIIENSPKEIKNLDEKLSKHGNYSQIINDIEFKKLYAHLDLEIIIKYYENFKYEMTNNFKENSKLKKEMNMKIDELNKLNLNNLNDISEKNKIDFLSICFPTFKNEAYGFIKEKQYTKEIFNRVLEENKEITFHKIYKNSSIIETSKTLKIILEKLRRMADKFNIWLGKFKHEFEDETTDDMEDKLKSSLRSLNKGNIKLLTKIANGGIFSLSKVSEMFNSEKADSTSIRILKKFVSILMAKTWTREINRNISLYQIASQQWNNEFIFHQISTVIPTTQYNNTLSLLQHSKFIFDNFNNSFNDEKKFNKELFKSMSEQINKTLDEHKKIVNINDDNTFYDISKFKNDSIIIFDKMPRLIPHDMRSVWENSFNFYVLDVAQNMLQSNILGGGNKYLINYS